MSKASETFFTGVGCMDGRIHEPVREFGQKQFEAKYMDTITEVGLVGLLAKGDQKLLNSLNNKITISLEKHHSRGIIVHGHQECAPLSGVSDDEQKDDVQRSVEKVKSLIGSAVSVIGVFVKRDQQSKTDWIVEEVS